MSYWLTPEQRKYIICKCGHNHLAHGPQHPPDEYEADLECRVSGCPCDQFVQDAVVVVEITRKDIS